MEPPRRDSRLLGLALLKGLLTEDELARFARKSASRGGEEGGSGVLSELVRLGRLDRGTLDELENELAGGGAPASSRPAGPPLAGERPENAALWGRYELGPVIGSGGMGQVYLAHDPSLGRKVALKFLQNVGPDAVARFFAEARAQARVTHPNICEVYEAGEIRGTPFLAIQYIDGKTLEAASPELTVEQKVLVMRQVAEAIQAAHAQGLIHRDIKPSNIMIERAADGRATPYVMDFGLARDLSAPGLTATGMTIGTPYYMAPEQVNGDPATLDRRVDVYGLGATLYEVLAGVPPFDGGTSVDIMIRLVRDEVVPLRKKSPQVPEDLETIVMRCLEKDRDRRYDSAKALADDLGRYLGGDPIQARKTSLGYRVKKRAAKNKAATAAIAVSTILLLALLGMWLQTRWTAAERTRLARQLGQRVAKMDEIIRLSHTIPLHDTRPEKATLRRRMTEISAEARRVGRAGEAPGRYAVGRGHLALAEWRKAREHLEGAWKAGLDEPDVAYALGLALGRLYKEELDRLDALSNKEQREKRRKAIDAEYRAPAVAYLEKGKDVTTDAPEYLEGLLAFYQKRPEAAVAKARAALKRAPWLYEAKTLEGEVWLAQANQKRDSGDETGAIADYASAETAFEEAARIGPSDPQGYEGLAAVWANRLSLVVYGKGGDVETPLAKVKEAAGKADLCDAERGTAQERLAWALRTFGEYQRQHGGDPVAAYDGAIAAATRTIERQPESVDGHRQLGTAFQVKADWEDRHGRDPGPLLDMAIACYRKAIALNPADPYVQNNLGNTWAVLAGVQDGRGQDPRLSFQKSIDAFREAIRVDPGFSYAWNNLGITYKDRAEWEKEHGLSAAALASLTESLPPNARAVELNPKYLYGWNNLGSNQWRRGALAFDLGQDPTPDLDAAERSLRKAIEINSDYGNPHSNLCALFGVRAALAASRGDDPRPLLVEAVKESLRSFEVSKGTDGRDLADAAERHLDVAEYLIGRRGTPEAELAEATALLQRAMGLDRPNMALQRLGRVDVLRARWLIATGASPDAALARARETYGKLFARNPKRVTRAHAEYAAMLLLEAQVSASRGKAATASISEGLAQASLALAVNPELGEAHLAAGGLHLVSARIAPDPAARSTAARAAVEALEKAIATRPRLKRQAEPLLAEARRLSG